MLTITLIVMASSIRLETIRIHHGQTSPVSCTSRRSCNDEMATPCGSSDRAHNGSSVSGSGLRTECAHDQQVSTNSRRTVSVLGVVAYTATAGELVKPKLGKEFENSIRISMASELHLHRRHAAQRRSNLAYSGAREPDKSSRHKHGEMNPSQSATSLIAS